MHRQDRTSKHRSWQLAIDAFKSGSLAGALFTLKALAQDGDWSAYAPIGYLYETGGKELKQDFEAAASWYRRAIAEADDPVAHAGMARLYFNGSGVEQDYSKALRHCEKAGDDPTAWTLIGVMYHLGKGVEKDLVRASEYYQKAVDRGYVLATQYLGQLEMERGNYLKGLFMRIRSAVMATIIAFGNPQDERLQGCF